MEWWVLVMPVGIASRLRILFYRFLGLRCGDQNRIEAVRCRRLKQIRMGERNALSQGCWLWPENSDSTKERIILGDGNYFNRDCMIDACGCVEIGDENMFGPGVYITDSNHTFGEGVSPKNTPMKVGKVRIGNRCWIGAHVVILKDVELGDGCVVGAGAVVTRSFPTGSVIAGVPAKVIQRAA